MTNIIKIFILFCQKNFGKEKNIVTCIRETAVEFNNLEVMFKII